jgi:hypothetical protein
VGESASQRDRERCYEKTKANRFHKLPSLKPGSERFRNLRRLDTFIETRFRLESGKK